MQLRLPDLGEGVTEGEVARFLVKTGDSVKEDQVVLEVMTDKATVEIPTRVAGVIGDIFVKEGDMIKVGGQLLEVVEAGGVKTATAKPVAKAPAPQAAAIQAPVASAPVAVSMHASGNGNGGANIAAAPAVRKLAREKGINLGSVNGSGPNGRVLLSDLAQSSTVSTTGNYSYSVDVRPKTVKGSRDVERIPLRGLRKKIVEKMAISKRTAAHFTCVEECDVTELVAFRNSIKDEAKARGVSMTFMPFIAKACLFALRKYPELNSQLVEDGQGGGEILRKHYYNFGIAVDTEEGLTVPVVHDIDHKSLMELAKDIGDAGARARDRKLTAADFADSTFTITNAGKVGGLFATPVINYPEVAIMGVHEIRKRPWVVDGEIKIRDIMYVSISLDHRIVDGAKGILFLNEVNSYLSNPKKFLLEMV